MDIPVKISDKAVEEIQNIISHKGIPSDYGLRLGIKGGRGCAGVNFTLGFDKSKNDDVVYQISSFDVYIQKGQMMFLIGKEVDFYEGSDARGFIFKDAVQAES